jgi:hypothetical protein
LGRYFDDPVKDKDAKANHTWNYLIHADREKMSLEDFTKHVNEHQGGAYVAALSASRVGDCELPLRKYSNNASVDAFNREVVPGPPARTN